MIAFVLSGGGNRAAQQVGALQVLLEQGLKPDLLVGTSAGALNATFLAANPTVDGARRLATFWREVTRQDVYPGNAWSMLWRLSRNRDSLCSNANFRRFIDTHLQAAGLRRFSDIPSGVRLYMVAEQLDTGAPHVFGDEPDDLLLDALMASTAVPALHPPWVSAGVAYVDGALVAQLPIRVAIERGARDVYALYITRPMRVDQPARGMQSITTRVLDHIMAGQVAAERQIEQDMPAVRVFCVPLTASPGLPYWDFTHAAAMMHEGRAAMRGFLDAHQEARTASTSESVALLHRIRDMVTRRRPLSRRA